MSFENDCRYLKVSRFLLTPFGLWPYQSTFSKRCNYLIYVTWTFSCLIPIIQGLGDKTSTDIVITYETIVALVMIIGSLGQWADLHGQSKLMKRLLERMRMDWQTIVDIEEKMILKEFSRQGRLLIVIFAYVSTATYLWFLCLTYLPLIFNEDAAANHSKIFPYYSHRWIINDNYRNLQVFVHATLGIFYAGITYLASTTFYVCNVKHICAVYAIVCSRLQKLLRDDEKATRTLLKIKKTQNKTEDKIMSELLHTIDMHRGAIESVHLVNKIFSRMYFNIEVEFLACLAIVIFDFNYHIGNSLMLSLRIVFIMLKFIAYTFIINYAGEQIIEYSQKVFTSTHCLQWYLMSKNAKNILLMLLRRTVKADNLSAGIMTCSLENFTNIIKASWSLACVLLSTHKK